MKNYNRSFKIFFFILIFSVSVCKLSAQSISFKTDRDKYFAGEAIEFSNTSSAEFTNTKFVWSFGNESKLFPLYSSNNKCDTVVYGIIKIKHKFDNPGQYKIALKRQNDDVVYSKSITVLPKTNSSRQKSNDEHNLVDNGDFEMCTVPNKPGEIYLSTGWYSISGSAADFFHRQFDTTLIYDFSMGIPHNFAGSSETAMGGDAYAGIITHVGEINYPDTNNYLDFKGYLFHELTQPMEQGKKYLVQFYCKLSSKSAYATNIGMYLTNEPVLNSSQLNNVTPQLYTTTIIHDTSSWRLITDTIAVTGGEQYLYIGNFGNTVQMPFPCNYISSIYGGFKAKVSYFYIDKVKIELIFNEKSERITLASTGGSYLDVNNEYSFEYSVGQGFNATFSDNTGTVFLTSGILQPICFGENKSEKKNQTMEVNLSPNPATDYVNISVSDCENENIYIDVIDMYSKTVCKLEKYYCNDKECLFKINLKQLQQSVYMIRVHNGKEKMKTIKIIKIN